MKQFRSVEIGNKYASKIDRNACYLIVFVEMNEVADKRNMIRRCVSDSIEGRVVAYRKIGKAFFADGAVESTFCGYGEHTLGAENVWIFEVGGACYALRGEQYVCEVFDQNACAVDNVFHGEWDIIMVCLFLVQKKY